MNKFSLIQKKYSTTEDTENTEEEIRNCTKTPFYSKLSFKQQSSVVKFLFPVPFIILLLFAGILAITQEMPEADTNSSDTLLPDDLAYDDQGDEESPFDWIAPSPPRWFRSNAGGMALEETPSRLAALRNKYALVIDYVSPVELESRLLQFYQSDYIIELRILFEKGAESRRQWLLRDALGNIRLNAVFRQQREQLEMDSENADDNIIDDNFISIDHDDWELHDDPFNGVASDEESFDIAANTEQDKSIGFIEVFNEHGRITGDYLLFLEGGETLTEYFYNRNMLIKAETQTKDPGGENEEYRKLYTDNYRYNRSLSLRRVERLYHGHTTSDPVYLLFPSRILDAVSNDDFMKEKLAPDSDFLGSFFADDGYRITYDTDSRGRILVQTMTNEDDEVIWTSRNTWSGDRIISISMTENDEERITEYEYDSEGKRIVQRDIRNGILERVVYSEGESETEELYMNGVVVLRAYWENGKKVLEERVRH